MKSVLKLAVLVSYWLCVGALLMGGMKLGDWFLPDPPAPRVTVKLECSDEPTTVAPRTHDGERDL